MMQLDIHIVSRNVFCSKRTRKNLVRKHNAFAKILPGRAKSGTIPRNSFSGTMFPRLRFLLYSLVSARWLTSSWWACAKGPDGPSREKGVLTPPFFAQKKIESKKKNKAAKRCRKSFISHKRVRDTSDLERLRTRLPTTTTLKKNNNKKKIAFRYIRSRVSLSNHLAETEERAEAYGVASNSMDRFMLP